MSKKKAKKGDVYVTKKHIGDESFDELDFELHNEFDFNYEDENDFRIIAIGDGCADAHSIMIDSMIDSLNGLKAKGATHVAISYHTDHIGYDISAYHMRKSTDDEIKVFNDKAAKERDKQEKLAKLYAKIHEIQNS